MFDNFAGNATAAATLEQMIERQRIPQTLLLHGPEGVGKATLTRRFAARLLGDARKIECDDLSLPDNVAALAEREKLPADKRAEDPFFLSTHPDFVTFAPEGPLRQISIQQMRLLKERAQFAPLSGARRVFLIDSMDRANEQAANSLLKTLEEPPPYLVLVMTAENAYDLLPTIRSRSVPIRLSRLSDDEMRAFARERSLDQTERRVALAAGSPGLTVSFDLEAYDRRREAMRALIEAAAGRSSFAAWAGFSEKIASARTEKLEPYLKVLYLLLQDIVHLREGAGDVRNVDQRGELEELARELSFDWIRAAVKRVDELIQLLRRNIQKNIALDAMVVDLAGIAARASR